MKNLRIFSSRHQPLLIALILLLGVAERVFLLVRFPNLWIGSDEANLGLMMLRLLQQHEWFTFIAGETYGGTASVALSAVMAAVTGSHLLALKLTALTFFLLFAVAFFLLARMILPLPGALVALLLVSAGSPFLAILGTRLRGPHGEALLLCTLLLWWTLRLEQKGDHMRDWVGWGVIAGFAWYTYYATLLTILPCLAYLALGTLRSEHPDAILRRPVLQRMAGGLAGFCLGALPWLLYCFRHQDLPPFTTESEFFNPLVGLKNVFSDGFPVLIGSRWPFLPDYILPFVSKLAVFMGLLATGLFVLRSLGKRLPQNGATLITLNFVLYSMLFSFSGFAWFASDPRYLIGLIPVLTIMIVSFALCLQRRSRVLAFLCILMILSSSVVGTLTMPPTVFHTIFDEPLEPLMQYLEQEEVHFFYANYWITYRLMFRSAPSPWEPPRLIGSTAFSVRRNRYPDYPAVVNAADRKAYITWGPWPHETATLRELLSQGGHEFKEAEIGRFIVFHDLVPGLDPQDLAEMARQ